MSGTSATRRVSPTRLFRTVAVGEAVTWALLLTGMLLKYVTETTELGVQVFGMVHGVVFIAYCLVAVLVAVDQRWSPPRTLLALVSAVPPFMTLWFDRYAERRGLVGDRWRLRGGAAPASLRERGVAWLLANPVAAALTGVVAVALLTAVALLAGPPG